MRKIRGVWLTTSDSNILDSKSNIAEAMKLLADTGFNTVFPVVWSNGYTLYPSDTLNRNFGVKIAKAFTGRDILQEVIEAATPLGLDIIPWFEYGFAASCESNGGHILERKEEWGGRDKNNNLLIKNGFVWMNSLDPEIQDFMLELFLEVVNKYPEIAGVQGDDRLPAMPSEGGYDERTKSLYRRQFGEDPPRDRKSANWLKWRANILSDFLAQLYKEVKLIDQNLIVSMSPSIYPFGYNEYLQDVPAWIDRGIIDFLHPQLYQCDLEQYKGVVDDLADRIGQDKISILSPGMMTRAIDYQADPQDLWQAILHNRRSGIRGETLLFFETLTAKNNKLANFLKNKDYANFVYLQQGNIGEDVQEIQQRLKSKKYDPGITDGHFRSRTTSAVEQFQESENLEIDGVVGPITYAKLMT